LAAPFRIVGFGGGPWQPIQLDDRQTVTMEVAQFVLGTKVSDANRRVLKRDERRVLSTNSEAEEATDAPPPGPIRRRRRGAETLEAIPKKPPRHEQLLTVEPPSFDQAAADVFIISHSPHLASEIRHLGATELPIADPSTTSNNFEPNEPPFRIPLPYHDQNTLMTLIAQDLLLNAPDFTFPPPGESHLSTFQPNLFPDLQAFQEMSQITAIPPPEASQGPSPITSTYQNHRCYPPLSDLWTISSRTTVICRQCNTEFLNTLSITVPHEKTHRPQEKIHYPCGFHLDGTICQKKFIDPKTRDTHLKIYHDHVDNHCPDPTCNEKKLLLELPDHVNTHKQKLYRCALDVCRQQTGASLKNLSDHYKKQHNCPLNRGQIRYLSLNPLTGLQYLDKDQPQITLEELTIIAANQKLDWK